MRDRVPPTTRSRTTTRMILTTGLSPCLTGGSGEKGGSEETGDDGSGTFAGCTLAPHAPQNVDRPFKGFPQLPQNLATMAAPLSGSTQLCRGGGHSASLRCVGQESSLGKAGAGWCATRRSLHRVIPDFLWSLVESANFRWSRPAGTTHGVIRSAAQEQIRWSAV
jgi:hypothetical protein